MSQAKDKAKHLYDKIKFETEFNSQPSTVHGMSKKLALICVDEMLQEIEGFPYACKFWEEVKQEIEKL